MWSGQHQASLQPERALCLAAYDMGGRVAWTLLGSATRALKSSTPIYMPRVQAKEPAAKQCGQERR